MWIMAKRNHANVRTGQKVITEGKQYEVIGYKKKDGYTVRNDNGKIGFYAKDIFQVMEQEPSCSYSFLLASKMDQESSANGSEILAGGIYVGGGFLMLLRFLRPL